MMIFQLYRKLSQPIEKVDINMADRAISLGAPSTSPFEVVDVPPSLVPPNIF